MSLRLLLSILSIIGLADTQTSAQSITTVPGPPMAAARITHQTQPLLDGKLLIMGGDNGNLLNHEYYNSCELYNPSSNSFEAAPSMLRKRTYFMSEVLNNGNVIAMGGDNANEYGQLSCESYDWNTQKWSFIDSFQVRHEGARSVKLKDGRILVAGGQTNQCEIYNPITNKWTLTGSMLSSHGRGMSLTLLTNGSVVAVGGEYQTTTIELFNVSTSTWTKQNSTLVGRKDHGAILMDNGNVLIAGTTLSPTSKFAEMYNSVTGQVSITGLLQYQLSFNKIIKLDNGKILTFGIGDLLSPSNTKIFQEYDPTNLSWTTGTYNSVGASDYTINRLPDGKILIAGGNFTTGNGATKGTILITQSGYSACITPDLNSTITLTSTDICYGKGAVIELATSSTNTIYSVYNGPNLIGTFTPNGQANSKYTILSSALMLGKNTINISAAKSGCVVMKLNQTIPIQLDIKNSTTTSISIKSGSEVLCNSGSNVTLQVDNPISVGNYQWDRTLVNNEKNYNTPSEAFAQHIDANGCYGEISNIISIRRFESSDITIQNNITSVCENGSPIQLNALPAGGTWSGSNISSTGLFTPVSGSSGFKNVTYSVCSASKNQVITVDQSNKVVYDASNVVWPALDTLCSNYPYSITAKNTNTNYRIDFYINNVFVKTSTPNQAFNVQYTPTTDVSVELSFKISPYYVAASCLKDSLIIRKTYKISRVQSSDTKIIIPDTTCSNNSISVKIVNPLKDILYYTDFSTSNASTQKGAPASTSLTNLDTLLLSSIYIYSPIVPDNQYYSRPIYIYAKPKGSCAYNPVLAQKNVIIFNRSTTVEVSKYSYVNEEVLPVATSNMDVFSWKIKDDTYNTKLLTPKKYSIPGKYDYSLLANSRFGCTDTIESYFTILAPPTPISKTTCLFDSINYDHWTNIYDGITDKKGNTVYVGTKFIDYGGSNYQGTQNGFIEKFDKNGKSIWKIQNNPFDYGIYANTYTIIYISSITCDENNDLYITGGYHAQALNFAGFSVIHKDKVLAYSHAFVAKISEDGKLIWFMHSTAHPNVDNVNGNKGLGGTDIKYSNGKLYVVCRLANDTMWQNQLGQKVIFENQGHAQNFSLLEIDAEGEKIKALEGVESYSENPFGGFYPEPKDIIYFENLIKLTPNIKILPNNKILVYGKYSQPIKFDQLMLNTSPDPSGQSVISEFSAIYNPLINGWESAKSELSSTGTDFIESLYNKNLDRYSVLNFDFFYGAYYLDKNLIILNPNDTIKINRFNTKGAFIICRKANGTIQWKHFLKDALIEFQSLTSDDRFLVVTGTFIDGIGLENYISLSNNNQQDLFSMVFDAQNGNLISAEKIGSEVTTDNIRYAFLNSCNDLSIIGERNIIFYGDNTYAYPDIRFDDEVISFAKDAYYQIHIPLNGICEEDCNVPVTTNVAIKTNKQGTFNFKMYPNPAATSISISTNDGALFESINITDLQGNTVKKYICTKTENTEIDVSTLTPGIYIIEVLTNNQKSMQKIIIAH